MSIMDQPLPILFVGSIVVLALVGGLLKTGRWQLLYAAIVAALLTVGLLIVERLVITPREEVRATLFLIADRLEHNDVDGVLEYVSLGRPALREEARRSLALVEIVEVKIKRNLRIEVVSDRRMEVAEAKFNAVVRLRSKRLQLGDGLHPRFCTVNFRREEDGVWRVRGYELQDPRRGI